MIYVGFGTLLLLGLILTVYGSGVLRTNWEFDGEGKFEWVVATIITVCGAALLFWALYDAPFEYNLKTIWECLK